MKFTKMQGIGNDYIYVNCFEMEAPYPEALARQLCRWHFGIGADGLILIKPSIAADVKMEMYNADGSRGRMCGNGIRCVAKYAYDHGLVKQRRMRIETDCGVREAELITSEDGGCLVRVDMGSPIFEAEKIPMRSGHTKVVNAPLKVDEKVYRVTALSMGNPHVVTYVNSLETTKVKKLGPLFEHHPCFPEGVNVSFVKLLARNHLLLRVWERGTGETLACGTGACAAVAASAANGFTDHQVTVHLPGGDLDIEWAKESNVIYMTGPAASVFEGEVRLDDIRTDSMLF